MILDKKIIFLSNKRLRYAPNNLIMKKAVIRLLSLLLSACVIISITVSCDKEKEEDTQEVEEPVPGVMQGTFFPAVVQVDADQYTVKQCDTLNGRYQLSFAQKAPEIKKGSVMMIENNVVLVTDAKVSDNKLVDIKGKLGDLSYVFRNVTFTLSTNSKDVETKAFSNENIFYPQMILCGEDSVVYDARTRGDNTMFGDEFKIWDKTYSETATLYQSADAKITATPTLSSSLNVSFVLEFLDETKNFIDDIEFLKAKQFNFTGRIYGDLTTALNITADIKKSGSYKKDPEQIVKNLMPRMKLRFQVGVIPVWVTMGCDLFAKAETSYSGELHYDEDFSASYHLEEGIKYRPYSYYSVMDKWKRIDVSTDFPAPRVSGKANWTGQVWVYPRFFADVDYIIGPSFEIKPYIKTDIAVAFSEGQADITKNFLANTANAYIGVDAAAGVSTFLKDTGVNPDLGMIDLGNLGEWNILKSPSTLRLVSSSSDKVKKGVPLTLKFQVNEKSFGDEFPSPFFPIVKIEIPKTGEYYYCFAGINGQTEFKRVPKSSDEIIYAKVFDASGHVIDQLQFGDGSMPEPTVSTGQPNNVAQSSAVIPVSWESEANVKEVGVYYSTTSTSPTFTDKYAVGDVSTGAVTMSQLTPGTHYFAKGYIKIETENASEVIFGDVVEFTTSEELKPAINVNITNIDFGSVKKGGKVSDYFVITNTGNANLTVTLRESSDAITLNWTNGTIAPGKEQRVNVTFSPTAVGNFASSISLTSNAEDGNKTISLSGKGIADVEQAARIELSKAELDFSNVKIGSSKSLSVSVRNTGSIDMKVSIVNSDTRFSPSWREATIKPNSSTNLLVTFTPDKATDYSAVLQFNSNATNGAKTVSLKGVGESDQQSDPDPQPDPQSVPVSKLGVSITDVAFGSITVGQSGSQKITLSNSGDKALTIKNITVPNGFTVDWTSATIASKGSKILTVTFTPAAAQSYSGNLVIESDADNGTTKTLTIKGTGLAKPEPKLSVSTNNLDFGNQIQFASETRNITITNSGTGTLQITSITKTRDYGDLFTLSGWTSGGSIAAGASKTISVTFSPIEQRTYEETLTIVSSNATNSKTQKIIIRGTGIPEPENPVIKFSESDLSWGEIETGESLSKSFTVTNTGTTVLNISSIKIVASDNTQNPSYFTISPNTACSINPSKSKTFTVLFSPEEEKAYNALVSIKSNATNATQGTSTVGLSGTGKKATSKILAASPSSISFGMQTVGNRTHKNFTVKNTGTKAVSLYSMEATDGFIVDQTWEEGYSHGMAPGSSSTFSVYFSPTEVKSYTGQIVIKSNASNGDLIIPLSGTGAEEQGYLEITSGDNLEFGDVNLGASSALYTKIKNTGDGKLNILGIDCPEGFSASCSVSAISAGYNATISVSFTPTQVKAYSGTIIVRTDAENGTVAIGVTGNGKQTSATTGFVDMGLSVKWAATNIGASSPEEAGHYVAWGETSTKTSYSYKTYKYYNSSAYLTEEGWITKYCDYAPWGYKGYTDALKMLTYDDDYAQARLRGLARTPTRKEWEELYRNCTWTWTQLGGKNGYQVTSKINGNTIFIPAGGIMDTYAEEVNETGYYWTSDLNRECTDATTFELRSTKAWYSSTSRDKGLNIRAVEDYEAKPRIYTYTKSFDFTKTKIGTSASQTVAISNTGKGTLHITNISTTKRWSVDWTTATIEPGSYKTLTITYTPVKDDSLVIEDELTWDWSTINIECDAFNEPDYILSVKGYGVE